MSDCSFATIYLYRCSITYKTLRSPFASTTYVVDATEPRLQGQRVSSTPPPCGSAQRSRRTNHPLLKSLTTEMFSSRRPSNSFIPNLHTALVVQQHIAQILPKYRLRSLHSTLLGLRCQAHAKVISVPRTRGHIISQGCHCHEIYACMRHGSHETSQQAVSRWQITRQL